MNKATSHCLIRWTFAVAVRSAPLITIAFASACSAKSQSGFGGGSGSAASGSGNAASGGSVPTNGGITISDAGQTGCTDCSDAGAFDYDASLAPPMENPTKVAGMMYTDFPSAPVIDSPAMGTPAPANAAQLFGAPGQGAQTGGPCLMEPEPGALLPRNWLRPRFKWIAPGQMSLFELRVHAANQKNDLVVYTTVNSWTMPKAMWDSLHEDSYDEAMTVSVRGGTFNGNALAGEAAGSSASMQIAPVAAPGSIVYWTTTNGTALKGFRIGDETVETVLTPPQVQEYPAPNAATCVGCHTATPDGDYASVVTQYPGWHGGLANIQPGQIGGVPPWLGAGAQAFLAGSLLGINTYSPGHWTAGDRVEISMNLQAAQLIWIDLEAATMANASGVIARHGDMQNAGAPSWSHDGKTIAYVSAAGTQDGRLSSGPADIYLVPYNNRAGGNATPLAGASDPNALEYYPAFSPDDKYIAFSKLTGAGATAKVGMYSNPGAEVDFIPSAGGVATRLKANDPPACSGETSPGVTNSWPKTAPEVGTALDGRTFYWIVFSSTRDPFGDHGPQLYVTPVVVDKSGAVTTYGALYLWNQPEAEHNHTPAWENFRIPPVPPTIIH